MEMDEEITNFLQDERRIFEEARSEVTPRPIYINSRKGKGKIENEIILNNKLKEQWRQTGRKEVKIVCHNINGLKTKGWKLVNLVAWAEEEDITILELIETNIAEREGKFMLSNIGM